MGFTSEERLLLEQIFRLLETNNDVRYHPHRRLLNQIMNDTVQSAALENRAGYVGVPTTGVDDYEPMQSNWEVVEEGGVAFPTGGADTAEAAAEAVLPVCSTCGGTGEVDERAGGTPRSGSLPCPDCVGGAVLPIPQRGDRVRLEGARSIGGFSIDDGWYTVTGGTEECFQVAAYKEPDEPDSARRLAYVPNNSHGLKEVRHAGH
jgi:hypothetical protein